MQAGGAVQGVGTIHPRRRRRLNALVAIAAIVVIAAVVALMVWVAPLARSGVGAEDALPNAAGAGVAVIHDDAGNMPTDAQWGALQHHGLYYPLPHGKMAPGAGSAVIHDDPGNVTAQ
jgi:hypothetical protein